MEQLSFFIQNLLPEDPLITQTASLLADARKLSNCPPCYEDCKWISDPAAYKWTLSNDGTNGEHTYGLWFRISGLAVA